MKLEELFEAFRVGMPVMQKRELVRQVTKFLYNDPRARNNQKAILDKFNTSIGSLYSLDADTLQNILNYATSMGATSANNKQEKPGAVKPRGTVPPRGASTNQLGTQQQQQQQGTEQQGTAK